MHSFIRAHLRQFAREYDAANPLPAQPERVYAFTPSYASREPIMRLVAAVHYFAVELATTGPCAEVEDTLERLERSITARLPAVRPIEARIALEMAVQEHAQAGHLHPRVLDAFGLVLLGEGTRTDVPGFGMDTADWY